MVPANVILRVFYVRLGQGTGTAFAIDVDGRRYFVTARHVIDGLAYPGTIEVLQEREWKTHATRTVWIGEGEVDIAVLAIPSLKAITFPAEPTTKDVIIGQEVFFLGFPFFIDPNKVMVSNGQPIPLIKRALLSGIIKAEPEGELLYLDGINNPGFSGSPVVFRVGHTNEFRIAGVVSGYLQTAEPVYIGEFPTGQTTRHNTGVIQSFGIDIAVRGIRSNPIGSLLD